MTRVVVQRNLNNNNSNSAQQRQSISAPQSTTNSLPSSANSSTSSHPQSHSSSLSLSVPFCVEDGGSGRGGPEDAEQLSIHSEEGLNFGDEISCRLVPAGLFEGKASDRFHHAQEPGESFGPPCRADDAVEGGGDDLQERIAAEEWNGESSEGGIGQWCRGSGSGKGKEVAEDGRCLNFEPDEDYREASSSEGPATVAEAKIAAGSSSDRSHTVFRDVIDEPNVQIRAAAPPHVQASSAAAAAAVGCASVSSRHVGEVSGISKPPDQGRPNSSQSQSEGVGCSYLPASAPSPPSSTPSSRRNSLLGTSAGPPGAGSRGGLTRRGSRSKPARNSPSRSRPSSPRAHGEGDGYNSSDEHNPRSAGSTFENNEEREHQFEVDIRSARNLEVRRMAEDGNCLFRAVADQVYGDAEMYNDTRQMCIDYMEKERDHFSQFVTESFTAYCKRKRRDKVYGNNLEIQAMAEMFNRPIHIYSHSSEPINIFHGSYETDLPPIRLSYHRGNHYDSLIDPGRPAVGAGLGFGSLRGTNVDREQIKAALKAQQDQQIDKALLAEGRFYSDIELTEQEIQRMVMEASRAEYFEEETHRQFSSWSDETSTSSAAAEPSSSGTTGSPGNSAQAVSLGASSTAAAAPAVAQAGDSAGLTPNVRLLISMGFSYLQVMEAHSIFGDDVNNMLCYLLETEHSNFGHLENMYRNKGKAAER